MFSVPLGSFSSQSSLKGSFTHIRKIKFLLTKWAFCFALTTSHIQPSFYIQGCLMHSYTTVQSYFKTVMYWRSSNRTLQCTILWLFLSSIDSLQSSLLRHGEAICLFSNSLFCHRDTKEWKQLPMASLGQKTVKWKFPLSFISFKKPVIQK